MTARDYIAAALLACIGISIPLAFLGVAMWPLALTVVCITVYAITEPCRVYPRRHPMHGRRRWRDAL